MIGNSFLTQKNTTVRGKPDYQGRQRPAPAGPGGPPSPKPPANDNWPGKPKPTPANDNWPRQKWPSHTPSNQIRTTGRIMSIGKTLLFPWIAGTLIGYQYDYYRRIMNKTPWYDPYFTSAGWTQTCNFHPGRGLNWRLNQVCGQIYHNPLPADQQSGPYKLGYNWWINYQIRTPVPLWPRAVTKAAQYKKLIQSPWINKPGPTPSWHWQPLEVPYPNWWPNIAPDLIPPLQPKPEPEHVPWRQVPKVNPAPRVEPRPEHRPRPRPRTRPRPLPFQDPAQRSADPKPVAPGDSITISPTTINPKAPGRKRRPPKPGEKERKMYMHLRGVPARIANVATEANDAIVAIYKALPWHRQNWREDRTLQEKLRRIITHADELDLEQVARNLIDEQIEDYIYGQIGRFSGKTKRDVFERHGFNLNRLNISV